MLNKTEIHVNSIGDGNFSDSHMHVPASDNDFLGLCSEDTDTMCYCMLNNVHISCHQDNVNLNKHRFQFPSDYVNCDIHDPRSELQIMQDCMNIINQNYPPEFKQLIDETIHRDASEKVIHNGVYDTHSMIKSRVKEWKKLNLSKETLDTLDSFDKPLPLSHPDHPYHNLWVEEPPTHTPPTGTSKMPEQTPPAVLQGPSNSGKVHIFLTTSNLHVLPSVEIFLSTLDKINRVPVDAVLDTGSSHPAIGINHLKQLKYNPLHLQNKKKFILNTTTVENDSDSILGSLKLNIYFSDINNKLHTFQVDFLVVNTNLSHPLIDICTLRQLNYSLNFQNNKETLFLTFPNSSTSTQIKLKPPEKFKHNQAVNSHNCTVESQINNANESTVENELNIPDLMLPNDFLEETVFEKNKFIQHHEKNVDFLAPDFSSCTKEEIKLLTEMFTKYESVFSRDQFDVGLYNGFEVEIKVKPGTKIREKPRHKNDEQLKAADELISGLIKSGIVKKADPNCMHAQNYLIVPKHQKNSNSLADKYLKKHKIIPETSSKIWRLCGDYRLLNKASIPLPPPKFLTAAELNLKLQGRWAYSFDISNCYFNLLLTKESQDLTTFYHGKNQQLYSLTRTPQGWLNSTVKMQEMLSDVFGRHTVEQFLAINPNFNVDKFINNLANFSDDHVVVADTREELLTFIECVLFCCMTKGLKLSLYKMKFFQTNFKFLNTHYDLHSNKISLDSARIQAIQTWTSCNSLAMLLSRMAILQYLQNHIPCFKILAFPLFALLRKKTFIWNLFFQKIFNNLKFMVKLAIDLTIPSKSKRLFLSSDASQIASSGAAMQFNETTKTFELIGLTSKLFPKQLAMRHVLHRELTSLASLLNTFEVIINNSKHVVTIAIDVIVMIFAGSNKSHNTSIYNISLLLSNFSNLQVISIPSESNVIADITAKVFSVRARKHNVDKDTAQHINSNFTKDMKIYTHEQVMKFLFQDSDDYIDCNEQIEHFKCSKTYLPIQRIEQLFERQSELEFLQCSSLDIDKISRNHSLWQRLKSKKNLNFTDMKKIVAKYKLQEADLAAFIMFNTIQSVENHDKCIQFYPLESRFFVLQVLELLKVTKTHSELYNKLQLWDTFDIKDKQDILIEAEACLISYYQQPLSEVSKFMAPIPFVFAKDSDITATQGNNCIHLHLKEDLMFTPGQLHIIKLKFLVLFKTPFLYFSPCPSLKKLIYNCPTSHYLGQHYFGTTYFFSDTKTTLKSNEPLFELRGFSQRINIHRTVKPIPLNCQNSQCGEDFQAQFEIKVISFLPVSLDPSNYKTIFEQYQQHQDKIGPLFEFVAMHYSYLMQNKNKDMEKVELFQLQSQIQKTPETQQKTSKYSAYSPLEFQMSIANLVFIQNLLNVDIDRKFLLKLFLADKTYLDLYEAVLNKKNTDFVMIENFIFRVNFCTITNSNFFTLVLPTQVAKMVLNYYHHHMDMHVSKTTLSNIFKRAFYVPNLNQMTKVLTDNCLSCNMYQTSKIHKSSGQLRTITPSKPMEHLILDCGQSLPLTKDNNCHILIAVDDLTGYLACQALPDLKSETLAFAASVIFQFLTPPKVITTDMSTAFFGAFSNYLQKMNILHFKHEARNSRQCGLAETTLKTFREYLSRLMISPDGLLRHSWDREIPKIVLNFNLTSPYNLTLSRAQCYFGQHHYYNFAGRFLPPISDTEGNDMTMGFINKMHQKRIQLNKHRNVNRNLKPGMFCCRLKPNLQQTISLASKYLLPSAPQTYLILHIDCDTAQIKCCNNGAVSTCSLAELRPLTFRELENLSIPPTVLTSVFESTKFKQGSQPDLPLQTQPTFHTRYMSKMLQKQILDMLNSPDYVKFIENKDKLTDQPRDLNIPIQTSQPLPEPKPPKPPQPTTIPTPPLEQIHQPPPPTDNILPIPPSPPSSPSSSSPPSPPKPITAKKVAKPKKSILKSKNKSQKDTPSMKDPLEEDLDLANYSNVKDAIQTCTAKKIVTFNDKVTVASIQKPLVHHMVNLKQTFFHKQTTFIPSYLPFDLSLKELDLCIVDHDIN